MSIKVIIEPTIYFVGSQVIHDGEDEGLAQFLSNHEVADWNTMASSDGEILPEIAGRLCYMSFKNPRPGGNAAYLNHILEVGHGSVLEHAVFNFIVTGVSRSLTHELVRHRVGMSYSQLSQRYVDESDVSFVAPPAMAKAVSSAIDFMRRRGIDDPGHIEDWWAKNSPGFQDCAIISGASWIKTMGDALRSYGDLAGYLYLEHCHIEDKTARRKAAREAARSVLPNCAEAKIFVTTNARALRHFIELRANAAADAEIRRLAVAWLRIVQGAAPNLFGDFIIEPCPLGGEMARTPYPKV